MFDTVKALDRTLARATARLPLGPRSRIVIFSDLHRGVGDWADDFQHNSALFACALEYYWRRGFTYIEVGDGDELVENRRLGDIVRVHTNIFRLLQKFHAAGRLVYIVGNHNLSMMKPRWREAALLEAGVHVPGLFRGLRPVESLLLGDRMFLFHGHQADLWASFLASISRLLVRHLWRLLQTLLGVRDPTSAAQNVRKRNKLESAYYSWAERRRLVALTGHTHRPIFMSLTKQQHAADEEAKPFYFNSGSGIHPRCVTCFEIQGLRISLVRWRIVAQAGDKLRLRVHRHPLPGCWASLKDIFSRL